MILSSNFRKRNVTRKAMSKLETAIHATNILEKKNADLDKRLIRQLYSLSIICDCFSWYDAQKFIIAIRAALIRNNDKDSMQEVFDHFHRGMK